MHICVHDSMDPCSVEEWNCPKNFHLRSIPGSCGGIRGRRTVSRILEACSVFHSNVRLEECSHLGTGTLPKWERLNACAWTFDGSHESGRLWDESPQQAALSHLWAGAERGWTWTPSQSEFHWLELDLLSATS